MKNSNDTIGNRTRDLPTCIFNCSLLKYKYGSIADATEECVRQLGTLTL